MRRRGVTALLGRADRAGAAVVMSASMRSMGQVLLHTFRCLEAACGGLSLSSRPRRL